MRSLSPAFVLTSVAIALASTAAAAQTVRSTTAPISAPTATPTAPTSSTARATTGGCTGTGGSSCTASGTTTSASSTGASSASSSAPSETTGANVSTAANNNATGAVTTVDNTSNNSTGPLSGLVENNGTTAISGNTPATRPSGTGDNNSNRFASGFLVPGLGTDLRALNDANNGPALNTLTTGNTVYTLPLYDATTKTATARELRRRATKQEPRIIGLAPRTDKDLTYQMPNDRIIRY